MHKLTGIIVALILAQQVAQAVEVLFGQANGVIRLALP